MRSLFVVAAALIAPGCGGASTAPAYSSAPDPTAIGLPPPPAPAAPAAPATPAGAATSCGCSVPQGTR